MSQNIWFHNRQADGRTSAGITVSRSETLPDGDFRITEYEWPLATLWFVDRDEFTADERQWAYVAIVRKAAADAVAQHQETSK